MATHIRKYGESSCRDHRAANGETIQAISQVHGIAGADNDQGHKSDKHDECHGPELGVVHAALVFAAKRYHSLTSTFLAGYPRVLIFPLLSKESLRELVRYEQFIRDPLKV